MIETRLKKDILGIETTVMLGVLSNEDNVFKEGNEYMILTAEDLEDEQPFIFIFKGL